MGRVNLDECILIDYLITEYGRWYLETFMLVFYRNRQLDS